MTYLKEKSGTKGNDLAILDAPIGCRVDETGGSSKASFRQGSTFGQTALGLLTDEDVDGVRTIVVYPVGLCGGQCHKDCGERDE